MELDQLWQELQEPTLLLRKDSHTRKFRDLLNSGKCVKIDESNLPAAVENLYFVYSGSLSSKATLKWTDANLNKWLKSPAEFAPGMSLLVIRIKI